MVYILFNSLFYPKISYSAYFRSTFSHFNMSKWSVDKKKKCHNSLKLWHLELHQYVFSFRSQSTWSGATRNRIKLISGCISLSLYSAKDLISRYCSTDFLQCFAPFSWVIFLYMHKGNRIHGKEQLFSVLFSENNSFGVLPSFFA